MLSEYPTGSGAHVAQPYDRLVAIRLAVDCAWSDIDVLLRQRHDQILELVQVIRVIGGEPSIAIGLASRFAAIEPWLSRSERYEAEQRINVSLSRLLNLLAYHPDLRRHARFAPVRQQFKVLDEHIQYCRERYNDLVTISNACCERLPDRLLATQAGLMPRLLLGAAADERRDAAAARVRTTDPLPERGRPDRCVQSTPLSSVVLSPDSTAVALLP